jgi:hypothetical protein
MRVLKFISGILALCFWFSSFIVWKYFDAHATRLAEPETGRIYPLNTHGSVVYLTLAERGVLYGLMIAGVVFFLVCAVAYFVEKRS